MNTTREEFVNDVMSLNAEQFAELQVVMCFVLSLPKHQRNEAVNLYTSGMSFSDIVKRMAVKA